ncbi:conserved exported hypothetical protein [Planktothrix sp. PCC 11201]|uniref:hypothetical protein n=1 Tax=Planktothrix sp. PCC 11201 TaxID=1729650 RepID=UPI000922D311|nr:hypothetical protein [Planktothrix sp. PCC 11201]SKB11537.1 conserved exported hypothetical protein [Planktothrix sp. PCC 11201]
MIRRFAIVSSLVVLGSFGLSTVARAGEGGVAGSAAFTVVADKVTGVAVSAAVGKQSATAQAFNYDATNANGLQNSAFALGTSGTLNLTTIGAPTGSGYNTLDDPLLGTPQTNTFTAGYTITIGTISGNPLVKSP